MTQTNLQTSSDLLSYGPPGISSRLPNCLYIGTSKAGSTWIYQVLTAHPNVFMAPAKGAYYFDNHFERGIEWYRDHFQAAGDEAVIGEISHGYLYSRKAADRIRQTLPEAKLLVCLRNPIERAFSAYLDSVKNGLFSGTFAESLEHDPALLERGDYATYLEMYLQRFPRTQLHVAVFDELKADPQRFADDLFTFLSLPGYELTAAMRQKMMPAAKPRSRRAAQAAKRIARACERLGWGGIRGRAKRSHWVRNLLYRPYAENERPTMDDTMQQQLQHHFRPQVRRLDQLLGTSLAHRWQLD